MRVLTNFDIKIPRGWKRIKDGVHPTSVDRFWNFMYGCWSYCSLPVAPFKVLNGDGSIWIRRTKKISKKSQQRAWLRCTLIENQIRRKR